MAMADCKMFHLVRLSCWIVENDSGGVASHIDVLVEGALKELFGRLEKLMKGADYVRLKTLKDVLDVLSSIYNLEFFAAYVVM